jgi:hypothetical protein
MKAAQYIRAKEDQRVYKKIGNRYVEANDLDAYTGLREGWWLVKIQPGLTSMRTPLYPDNAEVEAAMKDAEDKIVEVLRKACEARPKVKKITPEFKRAWEKMIKKFGPEMSFLEYDSIHGIAETILKEVMNNKKK